MISLEDCIALCGLSEDEVLAIAEHEHVPEIVATAMAQCLMEEAQGPLRVRDIIRDDIRDAVRRHDLDHAHDLLHTLRHFLADHPQARQ